MFRKIILITISIIILFTQTSHAQGIPPTVVGELLSLTINDAAKGQLKVVDSSNGASSDRGDEFDVSTLSSFVNTSNANTLYQPGTLEGIDYMYEINKATGASTLNPFVARAYTSLEFVKGDLYGVLGSSTIQKINTNDWTTETVHDFSDSGVTIYSGISAVEGQNIYVWLGRGSGSLLGNWLMSYNVQTEAFERQSILFTPLNIGYRNSSDSFVGLIISTTNSANFSLAEFDNNGVIIEEVSIPGISIVRQGASAMASNGVLVWLATDDSGVDRLYYADTNNGVFVGPAFGSDKNLDFSIHSIDINPRRIFLFPFFHPG